MPTRKAFVTSSKPERMVTRDRYGHAVVGSSTERGWRVKQNSPTRMQKNLAGSRSINQQLPWRTDARGRSFTAGHPCRRLMYPPPFWRG